MVRTVLFVCTANICRSPMAEGVFRRFVADGGAGVKFEIDSAGTHEYQPGEPPAPLAVAAATQRGYEIASCRARRVAAGDFDRFDHILAMDRSNIASLMAIAPTRCKRKIELLLEYGDKYHGKEVPDPFGGKPAGYELALDMIEDGCRGLASLLLRDA
ncbi:MAG: low molecular weight protein-tyrosine-phosphatase [Usitatibacter sp.]